MSKDLFSAMKQSIIDGDDDAAIKLANQAIQEGVNLIDALNEGFLQGVNHIGEKFSNGDCFLPELIMGGETMKAAVAVLEPELAKSDIKRETLGTVVIGTVEEDIHDIGKTLVGTLMAGSGFEVHDIGVSVDSTTFIDKAREVNADIIATSALLTTTMTKQKDLVQGLVDAGIKENVKVMVGGAPVTNEWKAEIGADGYSEDAVGAVAVAKELLGVN